MASLSLPVCAHGIAKRASELVAYAVNDTGSKERKHHYVRWVTPGPYIQRNLIITYTFAAPHGLFRGISLRWSRVPSNILRAALLTTCARHASSTLSLEWPGMQCSLPHQLRARRLIVAQQQLRPFCSFNVLRISHLQRAHPQAAAMRRRDPLSQPAPASALAGAWGWLKRPACPSC
jgi:hypothetical protein